MENHPPKGLFGVPMRHAQEVRYEPTPIENIYYEIPLDILERLHPRDYSWVGSVHLDMHFLLIDEFCGLFKLEVYWAMELRSSYSIYLWREKHWYNIQNSNFLFLDFFVIYIIIFNKNKAKKENIKKNRKSGCGGVGWPIFSPSLARIPSLSQNARHRVPP